MEPKNTPEQFSYDFRKLIFSGPKKDATKHLLISWTFILIIVIIGIWALKEYCLPLATATGGRFALGSIIKLRKGRSP